jgi:hypothetical protein
MQTDWFNETKKILKENEVILRSYHLELDSCDGYISLTDDRMIFVQVKGFQKKSYNKIFDLPYENILSIKHKNDYKFTLNCKNNTYIFSTKGIPAHIVEKSIEYFSVHCLDKPITKEKV